MLNILEQLDELNKSESVHRKFDENHMLLVALSTAVMVAKNKELSKEYYQWTRSYLQHVRDSSGRQLANLKKFLQKLDTVEKEFKIEDELQNEDLTKIILPYESSDYEIDGADAFSNFLENPQNQFVASTPIKPIVDLTENQSSNNQLP